MSAGTIRPNQEGLPAGRAHRAEAAAAVAVRFSARAGLSALVARI
jgi:hypothetical protein